MEIAFWKPIERILDIPTERPKRQAIAALDVKKSIRGKCDRNVPHLIGEIYYQAVVACLEFKEATAGMDPYEAQRHFQKEVIGRLKSLNGKL